MIHDICTALDKFYVIYGSPCSLLWRHNGRGGVSNHRRLGCLLNRFSGTDFPFDDVIMGDFFNRALSAKHHVSSNWINFFFGWGGGWGSRVVWNVTFGNMFESIKLKNSFENISVSNLISDCFQIDGLGQERCNSIANARDLRLSCTNLSKCSWDNRHCACCKVWHAAKV